MLKFMPALNFKKQFAHLVESGEKRQTIRACRKDGRDPKTGDKLFLYTGMRTKDCRKLKEVVCKSVESIRILNYSDIYLNDNQMRITDIIELMKKDGFINLAKFISFFKDMHGLPFSGYLIKW